MNYDLNSKYIHVSQIENLSVWNVPEVGFSVIYGNTVKIFTGSDWADTGAPTPHQIESYPIIYGWAQPGDWIRIVDRSFDRKILQSRFQIVQTYVEKVEVVINGTITYLNYYQFELSKDKRQRNALQATKMADRKTRNTYYKVKER